MTAMLRAMAISYNLGTLLCWVACSPVLVNQIHGRGLHQSTISGGLEPEPCTSGCGYIWRGDQDTSLLEYANKTDNITTATTTAAETTTTTTNTTTATTTTAAATETTTTTTTTTTTNTSVHSSDLVPEQESQSTSSSLETGEELLLLSLLAGRRRTSSLLSSSTNLGGGHGHPGGADPNRQAPSTPVTPIPSEEDYVAVSASPRAGPDLPKETTQADATQTLIKPEPHDETEGREAAIGQLHAGQESVKTTDSAIASEVSQLSDDVIIDALFTNIDFVQDELEVCEEWLRQKLMLLTGPSVQDLPAESENKEDDTVIGNDGAGAGVDAAAAAAAAAATSDDDDDDHDDGDDGYYNHKQKGDEDIREVNDYDDDNEKKIAIIRDIQSGEPSRQQAKGNNSLRLSVSSNTPGPATTTANHEVSRINETNLTSSLPTPAPSRFHHSYPVHHRHSPLKESNKHLAKPKQPRADNTVSSVSLSERIVSRLSHRLEYLKTSLLDCYALYKDAS